MPPDSETLSVAVEHQNAGRLREAEEIYRQILASEPTNAGAWHLLGTIAYQRGNLEAAREHARRSLELNPDQHDVHSNLGLILHDLGLLDEAAECYRRALAIKPDDALALYNLAHTLREQRKLSEAAACCQSAIQLAPDVICSHVCLATLDLLRGDLERGWPEYEWRLKANTAYKFALNQFKQPRWAGEPLNGKTIVLHSEQGFGDTIQFVRYAPLLGKLGANVFVGCKRPLTNLLAGCPGIVRLLSDGDELPPYDFYSPLLSLPGILKTTLNTIPANVPYLFADQSLVVQWHKKLGGIKGVRLH